MKDYRSPSYQLPVPVTGDISECKLTDVSAIAVSSLTQDVYVVNTNYSHISGGCCFEAKTDIYKLISTAGNYYYLYFLAPYMAL